MGASIGGVREDGSGPNAVRASGTGAGGRWQVEGGVGGGGGVGWKEDQSKQGNIITHSHV